VSFAAITLCVASQRVFFVINIYFLYRLSPETFGYTLLFVEEFIFHFILTFKSKFLR
jgi:hypothetical protein